MMFLREDEISETTPLVTRLKQQSKAENRRRRSFYAALTASFVAWLVIGRELLGNQWLLASLKGLGIACGIGVIMSLYAYKKIFELEQNSGSTNSSHQSFRIFFGVVVGMMNFCMGAFSIYQIYSDVLANPVAGSWNLGATLTTFVGTYLATYWSWRET